MTKSHGAGHRAGIPKRGQGCWIPDSWAPPDPRGPGDLHIPGFRVILLLPHAREALGPGAQARAWNPLICGHSC